MISCRLECAHHTDPPRLLRSYLKVVVPVAVFVHLDDKTKWNVCLVYCTVMFGECIYLFEPVSRRIKVLFDFKLRSTLFLDHFKATMAACKVLYIK